MVGVFAYCQNAVVAGRAVVHDTGMVEYTGCERRSAMTVGAIARSRNMSHRLANGRHSVVAGGAVIHDTLMSEHGV